MIEFERAGIRYEDAASPVLSEVSLRLDEGELCLVIGQTGCGKSTLLAMINGLVPHFTGGTLTGRVTVAGWDTAAFRPRELAEVVGLVGQDPLAGFVTDTVQEELAYTMEQLAVDPAAMRARLEETLDLLGIAELRHRSLRTLSGGQQQRVAIGAALTAHPAVLVLDEPTSSLDPTSAEDVLAAITRLVHDLGITVVVAEHRLERVLPYADTVVYLAGDGTVTAGAPGDVLGAMDSDESGTSGWVGPPVIELGKLAGWAPLPLSVRDARRHAKPLRERLPEQAPALREARAHSAGSAAALVANAIVVRYGSVVAVSGVGLTLRGGEIVALMGRNGSGKSSLLWALTGVGARDSGTVSAGADGRDPAKLSPAAARSLVGLVPQNPADLLYLDTVDAELAQAERDALIDSRGVGGGPDAATARSILDSIAPGIAGDAHPRDLSAGQQLALVLAIQLTAAPAVVLLDEPTRGLDYQAKAALSRILDQLAAAGHAVVVATHDVEFAARAAERVVVMAEGEIVVDGQVGTVLTASPTFAPQVAKILAPLPYLTVRQVAAALDRVGAG